MWIGSCFGEVLRRTGPAGAERWGQCWRPWRLDAARRPRACARLTSGHDPRRAKARRGLGTSAALSGLADQVAAEALNLRCPTTFSVRSSSPRLA